MLQYFEHDENSDSFTKRCLEKNMMYLVFIVHFRETLHIIAQSEFYIKVYLSYGVS